MASEVEFAAMRQAIILSALGSGTTSPNPPVGCVILNEYGKVVGRGFHRRKGEAHAEVNALNAAGAAARGGTVVVTLEPCNHVGVTPACRQALLDAGVARVVIGVLDPTSRGEGGASALAAAGVDVEADVLAAEVLTVLRPWMTATTRGTPHVTFAYAIDDDETNMMQALRSSVDVIVTDNQIEEGNAAGHSARHFRMNDLEPPGQQHGPWLSDVYKLGVRTALLLGRSRAANSLLASNAVDQLVLAVPRISGETSLDFLTSSTLSAFALVNVTGWPGGQLVTMTKVG